MSFRSLNTKPRRVYTPRNIQNKIEIRIVVVSLLTNNHTVLFLLTGEFWLSAFSCKAKTSSKQPLVENCCSIAQNVASCEKENHAATWVFHRQNLFYYSISLENILSIYSNSKIKLLNYIDWHRLNEKEVKRNKKR